MMNKTAFKIFACFACVAAAVAVILLAVNFLGFAFVASDTTTHMRGGSPQGVLNRVSKSIIKTESGFELPQSEALPEDYWCLLLDGNGDIMWAENKPEDIPVHYSINDVAKMTRWFLNDYPVYVSAEDYGLLVLGIPKNAVGKYDMAYSMKWFETLPQRLIGVLVINIIFAVLLAFAIGLSLYKKLREVTNGINDLRYEKSVCLKERGIFKEISRNVNKASEAINRKNLALARRDNARLNWISGISHDIRTPLSVIMGYSEAIAESEELSCENKRKANAITLQSIKIKKLIEDLNLISSLEYDMQPSKKTLVKICPLLRRVVSEIINGGASDDVEIELDLRDEKAMVPADEALLERAFFNLINNSVVHNRSCCIIRISEYKSESSVVIEISDNGSGVSREVLDNINNIPKAAHGLGLPMAYKIVRAHGGIFTASNNNGFSVNIKLPSAN